MTTQLTSRKEMEHLFTALGIEFRVDQGPKGKLMLDFYINDASSTILAYAGQRYSAADLATSDFIKVRAAWLACYRLSQVGGNPSLFYGRYGEIMEELKNIQNGNLPLPDLSTTYNMVPTLSNIEHDPRYRDRTRRVDTETSTSVGGTRTQETSESPYYGMW